MCKIIGNSSYGLTAQGINEIMRFNTIIKGSVRMKDSRFSNPIIAAILEGGYHTCQSLLFIFLWDII